ncbi:hypothetical protein JCM11641_004927 [Rhodosporidiobolus odoratus]
MDIKMSRKVGRFAGRRETEKERSGPNQALHPPPHAPRRKIRSGSPSPPLLQCFTFSTSPFPCLLSVAFFNILHGKLDPTTSAGQHRIFALMRALGTSALAKEQEQPAWRGGAAWMQVVVVGSVLAVSGPGETGPKMHEMRAQLSEVDLKPLTALVA